MSAPRGERQTEFEEVLYKISQKDLQNKELTAREIFEAIKDEIETSSPHEIATILGKNSEDSRIEVIEESPYKYKIYSSQPS